MSRGGRSVGVAEPAAGAAGPVTAAAGGHPSRRRQATRERLLDAARDVFAERGVFGGTVEEICARAGYTRGAFYSNFEDKGDVLRALVDREHARLLAYLDANAGFLDGAGDGVASDPRGTMESLADRFLRAVPTDRKFSLIQAELETHAVRDPTILAVFADADARFRARISDFLERGLERLGRELVVDLADATDAVIAIVEASARRALLAGPGADPHALARRMLPLVIVAASRPRRTTGDRATL